MFKGLPRFNLMGIGMGIVKILAGIFAYNRIQKDVPEPLWRWGFYLGLALLFKVYYPLAKAAASSVGLDDELA